MRDNPGEVDRFSCDDVTSLLERQVAEETLTSEEQSALDTHLDHCRTCRDLVRWMTALPSMADELSQAEVHNAYLRIMESKRQQQQATHQAKIAIAAVAAAAAVAALVLDIGQLKSLFSDPEAFNISPPACVPVPLEAPALGVVMTYCEDHVPVAVVEKSGALHVSLRQGAVGLNIDPNRPGKQPVTVETPHGEIRVKGTLFTVKVDEQSTRVAVFRGVVAIDSSASDTDAMQVTAGQGANLGQRIAFTLSENNTDALRRVLEKKTAWTYADGDSPAPNEGTPTPTADPRPILAAPAETDKAGDRESESLETEATAHTGQGLPRTAGKSGPKGAGPSIDTLIQKAQSCLIARDWNCAASLYQTILQQYPGRPESTAVLVSLAKVELRRRNRPTQALNHYRTYRQRAPNGPMAEEALFGIAEAYRRLGNSPMEKETLEIFVEQYPQSSQTRRAHARLRQIAGFQ
jgi:TolA-binding protein